MKKLFLNLLLLISSVLFAQKSETITLQWAKDLNYSYDNYSFKVPQFQSDYFEWDPTLKKITFSKVIPLDQPNFSITLSAVNYQSIAATELYDIDPKSIPTSVQFSYEIVNAREAYKGYFRFSPIIKEAGTYKKVVSFTYTLNSVTSTTREVAAPQVLSNSVLASGKWHRFYVEKSGIYKVSRSFLQSLGLEVNVDPRNIKIYGNGGRMLPLLNATDYPNDLEENAIQFIGESDGVFDNSDYILFYAEGVDSWNTESLTSVNLFADKSYYYIKSSGGTGKRMQTATEPSASPTLNFTQFDDVVYYEKDLNVRTCAVRNLVEERGNCAPVENILVRETFNFHVTNTGNYVFKFWTGTDSEGNDTFITHDVPVN